MKQSHKRLVSWLLVLCMVLSFVPAADAASVTWRETDQKITAELSDRLVRKDKTAERDASEMVRVSIVLEKASTIEAGYSTMGIAANPEAMSYRAQLLATQKRMEKTISARALNGKALDVVWNMTLVSNLISAWVPYGSLEKIAAIDGVKSVTLEAQYEPAVAERHEGVVPTAYSSGSMIGSGSLWNSGYTGAGSRIAIVDTGSDIDHQSLDNGAFLYALAENAADKGMTLEAYKDSLDLMDKADIEAVLPQLHASERVAGLTAEDLYLNEKLAFGFNYVDSSLNIVHDYDQQGEHGSHVAGISTANRYIPDGNGGYSDARDSVMMQGVAPDAQLITMKVFGESSPFDSDYMAAIEDAIILDCDAVNLSLGTNMPGSPYTTTFNDLMEMMKDTDTVVVISAGNASNWAATALFGYLYNDDVSFDTVGAPGSYASAFTVASVQNDGSVGNYFTAAGTDCFYYENMEYGNPSFVTLDTSLDLDGTEYEYVLLDSLGYEEDYAGLDVSGKVVFVSRGTLNFAVKVNNAAALGAAAVVVYNNADGMFGMDLTGLNYAVPVASLLRSDAQAIMAASTKVNDIAYTGKMTVYGKMGVGLADSEFYQMSDFSSWGVPGSLTLKPEITAPGGEIYSLWGSNAVTGGGSDMYETMSGTSMAAPQVTGMVALMAQYYRENGLAEKSGISARHLAQSLLMSTAEPLYEEATGNYYSLLNQGAGLARVDLASQADSFIRVAGQDDYKVKAELGDDPQRTGIYNYYYMFQYNLVAMAYVGTQEYKEWGFDTMVDWYFIIDRPGNVYLMGFLEQDGSYYYLEHDILAPGGIYTTLDFEMETPYFGSAYFDGEMLYYSAYKESRDNVTLMAIDVAGGSKACYELGTFATGVWPVAGLMEQDGFENHIDFILGTDTVQTLSRPTPVEPQAELKGIREEKTAGTLNNAVSVMSNAGIKDELVYVNVTMPAAGTNGRMSVTFDPGELELVEVKGLTEASAYAVEEVSAVDTSVMLAFASAETMPADQTVFRLAFAPKAEGMVDVTVHTHELSDAEYWTSETLTLELPHNCPSAHFEDVDPNQWYHAAVDFVVEKGWIKGLEADKFGPNDTMNRAQFVTILYRMEGKPAANNTHIFDDIADGEYYTDAVYWALESGITAGATESTFEPYGLLSRSQLVSFMYRYARYKGYDISADGDLSGYSDADEIQSYAVTAWRWSIAHRIVSGYDAHTLAPMDLTNRSQAAAIFQRFAKNFMN